MDTRGLALIAALLICSPGFGRQATGPDAQAGLSAQAQPSAAAQKKRGVPKAVQKLIESLPPTSRWRLMLQQGARGDGIRRPWMNDMRADGVKLAVFTFEFTWTRRGRDLKDWRLVSLEYFKDFDRSQLITDPARLEAIKTSGLEGELRGVALARAKGGIWIDLPAEETGTGYHVVRLAENQWLPVQLFPWFGQYEPGTTPLMHAAILGDVPRIRRLLNAGADVDATSPDGTTALMYAAGSRSPAAVAALLDAGADVAGRTKDGDDALINAAGSGNAQVVELLLRAGADPNLRDRGGDSALSLAAWHHYPAIVRLLLQAGARK